MTTIYYKQLQLKKEMLEEIKHINYDLLHPDCMAWGTMTVDDAEDGFLGKNEFYDEWGTKSFNILWCIKDIKPDKYVTEWYGLED